MFPHETLFMLTFKMFYAKSNIQVTKIVHVEKKLDRNNIISFILLNTFHGRQSLNSIKMCIFGSLFKFCIHQFNKTMYS